MIGRTNAGFGGSFNFKKPLIHVNAPIGSTVEFSVNNIIVKNISPAKAIPNGDNVTADYYCSGIIGTYTITITRFDFEVVKTVEVNANKEYNVILPIRLYLYFKGDVKTSLTGGYSKVSTGTFSNGSAFMRFQAGGSSRRYAASNNTIDINPYKKLVASGHCQGGSDATNYSIGLSTGRGSDFIAFVSFPVSTTAFGKRELDISSLSTDIEYYIEFCNASSSYYTEVEYIYLEL